MVAFYNQEDEDIYTGGDHFIPQQYYRLGNFNTTVPTTETQQQGYGIPYTGAFTNSNVRRDNPNTGGYGTWGNLDQSTGKTFKIGDRFVTGYKNLNSGLYQDYAGLNIQNLGLGKKEEDAEYPGLFHNVSLKTIRKNPGIVKQYFERQDFKKQADLQKQLNLENKMAADQARREKTLAESGQVIHDLGPASTGTGTWHEQTAAKEKAGTQVAGPGFGGGAYFADGGRIGFFKGAQADTAEGKAMSPGTSASGGTRHGSGGTNDGKQNNILKNNYLDVETDLVRADPFVNFNVRDPLDIAKLQATIGYRNLWDNDDLSVEGKLGTDLGLFNTNTNFTETGIGDTDINYGNFSTTIDANKNLKNIGYNNTWNGINYGVNTDLDNTMFSAGIKFNNGGLVGIL